MVVVPLALLILEAFDSRWSPLEVSVSFSGFNMLFDFISIGGFIVCGIILELTEFLGTGELLFEVIEF